MFIFFSIPINIQSKLILLNFFYSKVSNIQDLTHPPIIHYHSQVLLYEPSHYLSSNFLYFIACHRQVALFTLKTCHYRSNYGNLSFHFNQRFVDFLLSITSSLYSFAWNPNCHLNLQVITCLLTYHLNYHHFLFDLQATILESHFILLYTLFNFLSPQDQPWVSFIVAVKIIAN